LQHGEARLGLEPRALVVGRSTGCELLVGDPQVSRPHARFLVDGTSVRIEDLGSANGVFVNGKKIKAVQALRDDDQIQIGGLAFVLKSEIVSARNTTNPTPATSPGGGNLASLLRVNPVDAETPTVETFSIEFLGTLADKCLGMGRVDEAERLLVAPLRDALRRARDGHPETPPHIFVKAAHYAVALADAKLQGSWFDYTIQLYAALQKPPAAEIVDQLHATVRRVPSIDVPALRAYVENMRQRVNQSPAERFVTQRLEGLLRIVSP
jgi:pSer/pThr/pTyr-binding forkhead associated (FHA) protein